jgi:chemotaxis protein MotB
MPANLRRRGDNGLNAWPGYVDALSTLLMVIIFVLLVFVLAQAFLSVTLSSRDRQLDQVNQELAKLTDMLSLERTSCDGADRRRSRSSISRLPPATTCARRWRSG